MSLPTAIVEVGFSSPSTGSYLNLDDAKRGLLDTNTLAPDDLWVDLTDRVVSINTRRGTTRADGPVLRYEAGTATIVLRNDDRALDPTNLSGPYVSAGVTQVEPMRAVRIRATWGDQTYHLLRGFADDWQVSYDGPNTSTVTLTCSDAFAVFASYDRAAVGAVGAGEDAGARIGRILTSVGWPTLDRVLDTGDTTVQSTTLADNALSELLLTADSEMGEFWMDPQGRATFRNRTAIADDARSAMALAAFGDNPAAVETTVNIALNPSLETDTTGWAAGGSVPPTLARSNAQALFGSWSLEVTWGTGGFLPLAAYTITGLTVGKTYTISAYVYVPTGSPHVAPIVALTDAFGTPSTVNDQWQRLTWTGTATSSSWQWQIWPGAVPTAGQLVYIDGLQVEEGTAATTYCDGDQTSCEWDGVAHASTSRRIPELPYTDAQLTSDVQSMANLVSIARTGGSAQVVEDGSSRTAYLTRTYQRHDLILQTDAESLLYAEQLVGRTASPELRFSQLVLNGRRDPDRLWPHALGREIGDRIRVIRRPPGGGSAIQRDVWIRGIQHQFTKEMDWKTTFVLQKAPDVTAVSDAFGRTTANGWGSADSGEAWTTHNGVAADYSVGSGVGRISVTATAADRATTVDVGASDQEITIVLDTNTTPVGGSIRYGTVGRFTDVNNHYRGVVLVTTGGVVTAEIASRVAGVLTTLGSTSTALSIGTNIAVRFKLAGTRLRLKVWNTSGAEPSPWTVDVTNSSLTTGTNCGAFARRETSNTNPTALDFDTFTATSLHVWT